MVREKNKRYDCYKFKREFVTCLCVELGYHYYIAKYWVKAKVKVKGVKKYILFYTDDKFPTET